MNKFKELIKELDLDESAFTDSVVEKLAVVMESQLSAAKQELEEKITNELEEKYDGELNEYKEFIVDQLDNYLNEWTTEFVESNQDQIEESVKVKTAEKVLSTFSEIVEDFHLQISEDAIDEGIASDELKESFNEAINENIALKRELEGIKVKGLIEGISSNFDIESKKEKFVSLAEGLAFDDEESFKEKLFVLAETVKGSKIDEKKNDSKLNEQETEDNQGKEVFTEVAKSASKHASILNYLQS